MMIMSTRYVLLLASLLFSVSALPLVQRDVVSPPITSPTADTIWHVGETQTVTWSTTGLPVNQTNPKGMLVLGYMYNNSENLMLNSPLATGLNYSVGQAQITVPDVPSRTDYIVVLFGDSGNASPEFTIINDASSSTPASPAPAPTSTSGSPGSPDSPTAAPAPSSPLPPPPANSNSPGNSPGNSGGSAPAATAGPQETAVSAETTASSSHTTTSQSSTVVPVTVSATPSSTQSNAAWQKHAPGLVTCLSVTLTLIYFTLS